MRLELQCFSAHSKCVWLGVFPHHFPVADSSLFVQLSSESLLGLPTAERCETLSMFSRAQSMLNAKWSILGSCWSVPQSCDF